jgi:uncharacterized membrane protein YidH (DUF202 family)
MTRRPGAPPASRPEGGTDRDLPDDADPEDMEPSLFRERTALAWHRTAIAFAALGGAVLKTAPAVGFLILAISALIFVLGRASRPGRSWSLLLITVAVTAVSLAALAVALFAGGHPLPPF